jgi:hypothetical protein
MNATRYSLIAGMLAATSLASAHLKPGSLDLGGTSFVVGQKINITWVQSIGHNDGRYDIYVSKDAGVKWTEVQGGWQGPKGDNVTITYPLTIPNMVSTTAQVRICQLAGGECVDANYILKSGNFTIAASAGIADGRADLTAPSMRFDGSTRSLETSFALASAAKVTLQAFDANGQVIATLLDGNREAGAYRLSLFSNRLGAASGHLLFKLTIGNETFTQSWNGL